MEPVITIVNSSKFGACAGSDQPAGACMTATETSLSPVLTRPMYSAIDFPPGTGIMVGSLINSGM